MSELKYLAAPSVDEKIIIATEKRPIATSGRSVVSWDLSILVIPSPKLRKAESLLRDLRGTTVDSLSM